MNIMTKMQTGQSISEADQKALLEWGEQMQKQAQAAQDLDTPIQKPADATPDIDQRLEASQQRLDKIGEEIEALGKVIEKNADVWRQEGEVLVEKKQAKVSELSARANMNAPKEERNALVAALEQAQQDFNEGGTRSTQKFEERNRPTMEKIQALQGEQSKEYALYTTLLQEKTKKNMQEMQALREQSAAALKGGPGPSPDGGQAGRIEIAGTKPAQADTSQTSGPEVSPDKQQNGVVNAAGVEEPAQSVATGKSGEQTTDGAECVFNEAEISGWPVHQETVERNSMLYNPASAVPLQPLRSPDKMKLGIPKLREEYVIYPIQVTARISTDFDMAFDAGHLSSAYSVGGALMVMNWDAEMPVGEGICYHLNTENGMFAFGSLTELPTPRVKRPEANYRFWE
ncbi:MAG: hypothetical protein KKC51_12320, partial [Verrucomicrobia bacterium]|nr:hypothetical protein [Verrucomicrobiota bacterium]